MYGYSALRPPCNSEVRLQVLEPVQLVSPDGSVRANFIRYGATVTNFFVKDKVKADLINHVLFILEVICRRREFSEISCSALITM